MMTPIQCELLSQKLDLFVVFRNLPEHPVLYHFRQVLNDLARGNGAEVLQHYADFIAALYERGDVFSRVLLDLAAEDENPYVKLRARREAVPAYYADCVKAELQTLSEVADVPFDELHALMASAVPESRRFAVPQYKSEHFDFAGAYEQRIADISKTGYGMYARHRMFRVSDGAIVPVSSPDPMELSHLVGYESERRKLIDNTLALLGGKPAANTLLYGDAGTGKSSSVKAVVNFLADRGLRLIEVRKDQLFQIPEIMEQLRENPLKFILFIDDLSFQKGDDNFSTLKAILEGSASARASNTVIYATSNRSHLVKETFSDRDGDDVHRNDTMQELISLSGRFGLTILFSAPTKDLYLEIVHELAREKGIDMDEEELDVKAAAFAMRKGGRSPRAAEQFTDSLLTGGASQ